ncbi:MAG: YfhO family protein [Lachnospiraceae bacterium]|nr:YfhO family protein [Lachnospiraceae bacterium]
MQTIKRFLTENKKDIIFMTILLMIVGAVLFVVDLKGNVFGERTDWASQHTVIPEYFRQTFYNTGDLFPDYNLQLFGGANAFNFSYYGYLNPIILISYLLPKVAMQDYIIASMVVCIYLATVLFFIWIKRLCKEMNYDSQFSLYVATCMFMLSAPLFFHGHMQIMFVNYMPFLIMGFLAVDKFVKKGKTLYLGICVTLLFLVSYFFAISATVSIALYAIFRVVSMDSKSRIMSVGRYAILFSLTVIAGIMTSLAVLLPSFVAIVNGRPGGAESFNATGNIILPAFDVSSVCYSPYGMGLSMIVVIAVIYMIADGNLGEKIISASVLMLILMPVLKLVLNGFIYVRAKVLIPFMPIALLIFVIFLSRKIDARKICVSFAVAFLFVLSSLLTEKYIEFTIIAIVDLVIIGLFYLAYALINYIKNREPWLPDRKMTGSIAIIISAVIFVVVFLESSFLTADKYADFYNENKNEMAEMAEQREERNNTELAEKGEEYKDLAKLTENCEENEGEQVKNKIGKNKINNLYRSGDLSDVKYTLNQIHGKNFNTVSGYSSVVNKDYMTLCYEDLGLSNPTVNPISVVSTEDVMFNILMGVKYLYTDKNVAGYKKITGYKKVAEDKNVTDFQIVENNDKDTGNDSYVEGNDISENSSIAENSSIVDIKSNEENKNVSCGLICNDDIKGIGFADCNVMSYNEYRKLNAMNKEMTLLDSIILQDDDYIKINEAISNSEKNSTGEENSNSEKNTTGEEISNSENNSTGEENSNTEKNSTGEKNLNSEKNSTGEEISNTEKNSTGEKNLNSEKNTVREGLANRIDDSDYNGENYFEKIETVNIGTKVADSYFHVHTEDTPLKKEFEIPNCDKQNVYVVTCHIKEYTQKRATVKVNGIKNSLSGIENAFPNDNFDFKYVFSGTDDSRMTVEIPKECDFELSALDIYMIKYEKIQDILSDRVYWNHSTFTNNNTISGEINVDKKMAFTVTLPYDEGFRMYVDGKEQKVLKTDNGFMGCIIEAGHHNITLKYTVPCKKIGCILTFMGIVMLILLNLYYARCKKSNGKL